MTCADWKGEHLIRTQVDPVRRHVSKSVTPTMHQILAAMDGKVVSGDIARVVGIEPETARKMLRDLERFGLVREVSRVRAGVPSGRSIIWERV